METESEFDRLIARVKELCNEPVMCDHSTATTGLPMSSCNCQRFGGGDLYRTTYTSPVTERGPQKVPALYYPTKSGTTDYFNKDKSLDQPPGSHITQSRDTTTTVNLTRSKGISILFGLYDDMTRESRNLRK